MVKCTCIGLFVRLLGEHYVLFEIHEERTCVLQYLYKKTHTHNNLKFAIVRELTSAAQNMEKSERVILYCLCLYIM